MICSIRLEWMNGNYPWMIKPTGDSRLPFKSACLLRSQIFPSRKFNCDFTIQHRINRDVNAARTSGGMQFLNPVF
jgi:hypothetical protein